jgi:hypothetical protein
VVVGVIVIGDVTTDGGSADDPAASDGSVSADQGAAGGTNSALSRKVDIDSEAFRAGVRRTFADQAAPSEGPEGGPEATALRPSGSSQDRSTGTCPRADLAAAGIPGRYGPEALLDGRPVTLVASGPERDTLVVAYSCATGSPVPQVRTHIDLTR